MENGTPPIENLPSAERLSPSHETVGVQVRFLIDTPAALDPNNKTIPEVTGLHTDNIPYAKVDTALQKVSDALWQGKEGDDFTRQKAAWTKEMQQRFTDHRGFWNGTKGKAFQETFKRIGFNPTNVTTDTAHIDTFYDTYFADDVTSPTKKFADTIIQKYTKPDGQLDYDRLIKEKDAINWIGGIIDGSGLDIVGEIIEARANMAEKPDELVNVANHKAAGETTTRINKPTNKEIRIMKLLDDTDAEIRAHPPRQPLRPTPQPAPVRPTRTAPFVTDPLAPTPDMQNLTPAQRAQIYRQRADAAGLGRPPEPADTKAADVDAAMGQLAQGVREGAAEARNRYADKILAGEDPNDVLSGFPQDAADAVLQTVDARRSAEASAAVESERARFEIGHSTEPSPEHPEKNEDAILSNTEKGFMGVFDGMGGHLAGEHASRIAKEAFEQALLKLGNNPSRTDIETALLQAWGNAQEALRDFEDTDAFWEAFNEAEKNDQETRDPGTTVSVVQYFTEGGKRYAAILQAGDSRMYSVQKDGSMEQVSTDDSAFTFGSLKREFPEITREQYDQLIDLFDECDGRMNLPKQGELPGYPPTLNPRRLFDIRNQLSNFLSKNERSAPVVKVIELDENTQFLMATTDGIHDNLKRSEIRTTAAGEENAQAIADALVTEARKRFTPFRLTPTGNKIVEGSAEVPSGREKYDDVTAVVMKIPTDAMDAVVQPRQTTGHETLAVETAPASEKTPRKVRSFKTAKGSVYTYDADGKTTRYKTATGELMPRQDVTVFVDLSDAEIQSVLHARDATENTVYLVEVQKDSDRPKIIRDATDITDPHMVHLAIVKNNAYALFKPVSLTPQIGQSVFDARIVPGISEVEWHLGNKVVDIEYDNNTPAAEAVASAETQQRGFEVGERSEANPNENKAGVKVENKDAVMSNAEKGFVGAFDGVGSSGQRASQLAQETFTEILSALGPNPTRTEVQLALWEACKKTGERLGEEGSDSSTTGSVVQYFTENGKRMAAILQIGDSRVYAAKKDGSMEQVSEDDSHVTALFKENLITEKQYKAIRQCFDETSTGPNGNMPVFPDTLPTAVQHELDTIPFPITYGGHTFRNLHWLYDFGNEMTKTIHRSDARSADAPDIRFIALAPDSDVAYFIATSDGIHDNLRTSDMQMLIQGKNSAQEIADALVHEARRHMPRKNWDAEGKSHDIGNPLLEVREGKHKPDDATAAVLRVPDAAEAAIPMEAAIPQRNTVDTAQHYWDKLPNPEESKQKMRTELEELAKQGNFDLIFTLESPTPNTDEKEYIAAKRALAEEMGYKTGHILYDKLPTGMGVAMIPVTTSVSLDAAIAAPPSPAESANAQRVEASLSSPDEFKQRTLLTNQITPLMRRWMAEKHSISGETKLSPAEDTQLREYLQQRLKAAGIAVTHPDDIGEMQQQYAALYQREIAEAKADPTLDYEKFCDEHPYITTQTIQIQQLPGDTVPTTSGPEPLEQMNVTNEHISLITVPDKEQDAVGIAKRADGTINIALADGVSDSAFPKFASRTSVTAALDQMATGEPSVATFAHAFDAIQQTDLDTMANLHLIELKRQQGEEIRKKTNLAKQRNLQDQITLLEQHVADAHTPNRQKVPPLALTTLVAAQYDKNQNRLRLAIKGDSLAIVFKADKTLKKYTDLAKQQLFYEPLPNRSYPSYGSEEIDDIPLDDTDVFLLTSDGFYDSLGQDPDAFKKINDVIIAARENGENIQEKVNEYIRAQLQAGGVMDDVSVVVGVHTTSPAATMATVSAMRTATPVAPMATMESTMAQPPTHEALPEKLQLTHEELAFYDRYMSYFDARGGNVRTDTAILHALDRKPFGREYVREMSDMLQEYGRDRIFTAANEQVERLDQTLQSMGIEPSPWAKDRSWFLWHSAKSRFLANHPTAQATLPNADQYHPIDPFAQFKPGASEEQIRASREAMSEEFYTMLGWEVTQHRSSIFGKIDLNTPTDVRTRLQALLDAPRKADDQLSSYQLREIGEIVNQYRRKPDRAQTTIPTPENLPDPNSIRPRPENDTPPATTETYSTLELTERGFVPRRESGEKSIVFLSDTEVAKMVRRPDDRLEMNDQLELLINAKGVGGLPVVTAMLTAGPPPYYGYVMKRIEGRSLETGAPLADLSQRLWLIQDMIDIYKTVRITHGDLFGPDIQNVYRFKNKNNLMSEDKTGRLRFIDWGDYKEGRPVHMVKSFPIDEANLQYAKQELSLMVQYTFQTQEENGERPYLLAPNGLDTTLVNAKKQEILGLIGRASTPEELFAIHLGV